MEIIHRPFCIKNTFLFHKTGLFFKVRFLHAFKRYFYVNLNSIYTEARKENHSYINNTLGIGIYSTRDAFDMHSSAVHCG